MKSKKPKVRKTKNSKSPKRSASAAKEPSPQTSFSPGQVYLGEPRERAILMGPMARPNAALKKALQKVKMGSQDLLVGIDAGTEIWMKLGKMPGLAVGDWDSISPGAKKKILEGVKHLTLPQAKDRTDLYYGMASAIQGGARRLLCFGVTGGLLDHHLAMILELTAVAAGELGPIDEVSAHDDEADYHFLSEARSEWAGKVEVGTRFSLFALQGAAHGVDIQGARFEMSDGTLGSGSQGISNFAVSGDLSIRFRKGQLLLILYKGRPLVKIK